VTSHDSSESQPERRSSGRRQADRALQESVERYRSLYESLECVYLLDFEGRFLDANWAALELLGYEQKEILTLSFSSLLDDDQSAMALGVLTELKETGSQKTPTEFRLRRKTGEYVDVETQSSVVFRDEQPYAVLGVGRDITERKAIEAGLDKTLKELAAVKKSADEASEFAESVINTVREPLLALDQDLRVVKVSRSFYQFFKVEPEETVGRLIYDLGNKQWDIPKLRELLETILPQQTTFDDYEVEHEFATIGRRTMLLNARQIEQVMGKERIILLAIEDITERKEAEGERLKLERQLHQSQKLESLGILAGGIAHDFNNILMVVLGNAELALSELSPAAPARENLLEITRASRRAAGLSLQMLAYSGRGHFVIEPIDLGAFIEDGLELLKSTISKKAVLDLKLEKDLPFMEGDPSQLGQVIMNLVINASEAIGERSGIITISTGARECSREYLHDTYLEPNLPPGLYLTLEVSDTGSGMDEETQARLFEPFFTTKFTGRGLGLSAVLGIVRGHKGTLKLESELGKGTTFSVLFPASEAPTERQACGNGAQTGGWRTEGTVLLVDDEETIRTLGAGMLTSLGCTVLTAADGREALEVFGEHREEITLVLLDLTMPHMDGEEAFRELRLIDPEVRVIISSGYTEKDVTSRFAGQAPVGFLQKPYSMAELTERLRAALEGGGTVA
jgi:two-component system cell cycle sensor histidine kinase/response regulator CckA